MEICEQCGSPLEWLPDGEGRCTNPACDYWVLAFDAVGPDDPEAVHLYCPCCDQDLYVPAWIATKAEYCGRCDTPYIMERA